MDELKIAGAVLNPETGVFEKVVVDSEEKIVILVANWGIHMTSISAS